MKYEVFLWCALAILVAVVGVWAISVRIADASIVDIFWGFGFVVVAWVAYASSGGPLTFRRLAILAATTAWGLRLTAHLAKRNLGKGEDFRYKAMRKKHGAKFPIISLVTVYLVQGAVMFVVSLPVQVGLMRYNDRTGWIAAVVIGVMIWAIGFGFETIGDAQLTRFMADASNKGKVLNSGLWSWTRHPNYFGDSCAWWGIWVMAASVRPGLATIISPLVMTFTLRKVSGVPMLEHSMAKRRPGYAEYVKTTSAFVPRPPKRSA
jgi:steroid 5-alpha reductase family enzyme